MKGIKLSLILLVLLLPLPVLAVKLDDPLGITSGDPREIFTRLVSALALFTGILALVFFVLGGYRILTAAGNSEHFAKGKTMLLYSIVGFVVTLSSYYILFQVISILTTGGKGIGSMTTASGLFDPLQLSIKDPNTGAMLYGERILRFLLSGLGGLTLLMFVYGGLQWMLAEGNEEKITKAKRTIMYAILGLAAVLGSYIILRFAYMPFYNLLSPIAGPQLPPGMKAEDLAPQTQGACFFNSYCIPQSKKSDCVGDFYEGVSCSDIGCCKQTAPCPNGFTVEQRSFLRPDECVMSRFSACSTVTLATNFSCPNPTLQENNQCYMPVKFIAGRTCQ